MGTTGSTKGRCLCGKVTVHPLISLSLNPLPHTTQVTVSASNITTYPTLCCHCTSCKRRSGGLASYAFCVPASIVTITGSSHKTTEDHDTGSGNPMTRTMCCECGSPVAIVEAGRPDTRCLQYGLFAGVVELPKPQLEMFAGRMCKWETKVGEDVREEM